MQIFEELKARGLIAQLTDEEEIRDLINAGKATFYIGFDATADSLHIGHFMALNLMRRLQLAGNRPIALLGGGTTMVGDPSGRTDMRQMLTEETIAYNAECFKRQMERFIEFGEGKAVFYQNGTWEYANLTGEKFGMDPADLVMIPIYIGVEGEEDAGLACGTENCWAVNSQASEADQKATLDFLYWVVTSETGTTSLADDMGFVCPFRSAKPSTNYLVGIADQYIAAGKKSVDWCFPTMPSEEWKNGVGSALTAYAAGTGKWDDVVTAFVDGWAKEYKLANG